MYTNKIQTEIVAYLAYVFVDYIFVTGEIFEA